MAADTQEVKALRTALKQRKAGGPGCGLGAAALAEDRSSSTYGDRGPLLASAVPSYSFVHARSHTHA